MKWRQTLADLFEDLLCQLKACKTTLSRDKGFSIGLDGSYEVTQLFAKWINRWNIYILLIEIIRTHRELSCIFGYVRILLRKDSVDCLFRKINSDIGTSAKEAHLAE